MDTVKVKKFPLLLSDTQIKLIQENVLMLDAEIEQSIQVAEVVGKKRKVMLSPYDLEDLEGHIAATANHCEDTRVQSKLDSLLDVLAKAPGKKNLQ